MRPSRLVLAAISATSAMASLTAVDTAAAAPPPPCGFDYCVGDDVTLPGAPGDTPPPSDDGGQVTPVGNGPRCTWVRDPGPIAGGDSPGSIPDVGVRPSDDAYLVFEICDGEPTGRIRWAFPAAPPPAAGPPAPAVTPAQLAATIRVRLEGNLPQPVITTSPPAGEAAVVNHPTFLAVDNWDENVTDQECAFLLCVTVTAVATLEWTSGEPGSGTLACAGAGTRFDPSQGSPQDQAAVPGACAHPYQTRTGAAGRPAEWPGVATVTWTLSWTSTGGASDTLPPIVRSADVPRAVEEVQAIVVH